MHSTCLLQLLDHTDAGGMNYTRVPNDVAGALPRHRARSDAAAETEDVPPSTAYEQTAILNAAKNMAFRACKVVR